MRRHINEALKVLNKVFNESAYSTVALNESSLSDMSTKLIYGVLEQNIKIDYILSSLVVKKPQKLVYILLKIGTYCLLNLDNVPTFAIVSECVEVAKMNGKQGASGFVNAVLKKVATKSYSLPDKEDNRYLAIKYSKPQWFIDRLIREYGIDNTLFILNSENLELEHIRVNNRLSSLDEIIDIFNRKGIDYRLSGVGGIIVKANDTVKHLFSKGMITYQSPSSMIAVKALNPKDNSAILDLCSAPGGKAIYMSELCPHSKIIACDLHQHRVKLIQKYKERMHTPNVKAVLCDATILNSDYINAFDYVLVDAPCSCFGTYKKHPDVFLSRDESAIGELSITQSKILDVASNYVKVGGYMVYSTCTMFKEENNDIVNAFLQSHPNFSIEKISDLTQLDSLKHIDDCGMIQILPNCEYDGFFVARLRRND